MGDLRVHLGLYKKSKINLKKLHRMSTGGTDYKEVGEKQDLPVRL